MKKYRKTVGMLVLLLGIAAGIAGCSRISTGSPELPVPDNLYAEDSSIDMFIYGDTAYVNAEKVDWVSGKELTKGECIGEISDTGVMEGFQDWDATVLEKGTLIYETDDAPILLAESNERLVPYLKYAEG